MTDNKSAKVSLAKTTRMTRGDAVANPLTNQVSLWEKAGWKISPKPAPLKGDKPVTKGDN